MYLHDSGKPPGYFLVRLHRLFVDPGAVVTDDAGDDFRRDVVENDARVERVDVVVVVEEDALGHVHDLHCS